MSKCVQPRFTMGGKGEIPRGSHNGLSVARIDYVSSRAAQKLAESEE